MPPEGLLDTGITLSITLFILSVFNSCSFFLSFDCILQGVDSLAAWITNDHLNLEFEVKDRYKYDFYTKQEISHLLVEKTKLDCYLK